MAASSEDNAVNDVPEQAINVKKNESNYNLERPSLTRGSYSLHFQCKAICACEPERIEIEELKEKEKVSVRQKGRTRVSSFAQANVHHPRAKEADGKEENGGTVTHTRKGGKG